MSDYNLLDDTDSWMTRPKFSASREKHLYPSEASVKFADSDGSVVTEGTCHRATYLRFKETQGLPNSARSEWIFAQGKLIEQHLIEQWKQMGIWVTNNVEFYWPEYNISGELDVILREPGTTTKFGVEVKTFYGYDAHKEIMGNKSYPGFPKMSQLLQTLVYTYRFKDQLDYFKMVYFARDDVKRREFKIQVVKEETNSVEIPDKGTTWWPVIDGKIYKKFSINDILARYSTLKKYIDQDQVPPNDYELVWSPDKVEREKAKGNVSKTAYEEWKKGRRTIGDWQCSYCSFKDICWGNSPNEDEDLVQIG